MRIKSKTAIAITVAAAGCALIVLGALTGGYTAVLKKAVFICLECIGLG